MIGFAVLIVLAGFAEASPEKTSNKNPPREPAAIERLRAVLPKDWTIELRDLPDGIQGIALGPRAADGRPVLVAVKLADTNAKFESSALEEKLGAKLISFGASPIGDGVIEAQLERIEGGEAMVVVHAFGGTLGEWALTLIAPKPIFDRTYKTLLKAAEGLRK
jgi:hypothetical protein